MQVKVCGNLVNIPEVSSLPIDYLGLIFAPKSPRCYSGNSGEILPRGMRRQKVIGVFVNQPFEEIVAAIAAHDLSGVQLHGDEPPELLLKLKSYAPGVIRIKAFGIESADDFERTGSYEDACEFFLFDSKSQGRGGSGARFDWKVLSSYNGVTPYFLAGGVGPGMASEIAALGREYPALAAIDLNSRFETAPGEKDISALTTFIKELRDELPSR